MNSTRSRDAEHVKATAAFIEDGRAYLVLAIGAGLLVPLAVHALADPAIVAAAVYEHTGRCLLVPADDWSTHLRQILVCGRAAA